MTIENKLMHEYFTYYIIIINNIPIMHAKIFIRKISRYKVKKRLSYILKNQPYVAAVTNGCLFHTMPIIVTSLIFLKSSNQLFKKLLYNINYP